ncbi:hypothetical protein MPSEU_000244700 [Mayamaea pseudoterrestris]|nr:hypothetical protein MPSEU_000244700 [Mayamaea pseudoterrestris]
MLATSAVEVALPCQGQPPMTAVGDAGGLQMNEGWKRAICTWTIGQEVTVKPRLWPGINRPGGHGKVSAIHLNPAGDGVESLDIKYTIERSCDRMVAVEWIDPHATIQRDGRSRKRSQPAVAPEETKENKAQTTKRRRNKSARQKTRAPAAARTNSAARQVTLPAKDDEMPIDIFAYEDDSSSVVSELSEGPLYKALASSRAMTTNKVTLDGKPAAPALPNHRGSSRVVKQARLSSPSRTQIAADASSPKAPVATSTARHVTLGEVYAYEVQQARQFIDQVVLHQEPSNEIQEPLARVLETIAISKERNVFETLFYELLVDEGDGQIDEDVVTEQVNALAQQRDLEERFDETQVSEYIASLCSENKIMRSDGQLYNI